jgi:hypothetical protein
MWLDENRQKPGFRGDHVIAAASQTGVESATDMDILQRGLMDFRRGRYAQAIENWKQAWTAMPARSGWSRGRLAYYLGICHGALGDQREQELWFERVKAETFEEIGIDNDNFFEIVLNGRPVSGVGNTIFINAQIGEEKSPAQLVLESAREVIKAKVKYQESDSLEDKILFCTWQMLFAELATDQPRLGLYSNSRWAFEEGIQKFDEITKQFDEDPALMSNLAADQETHQLIIRLDTVRTRFIQVEKRQLVNKENERKRLDNLRDLVRTYRDLTESLARCQTAALIEDLPVAESSYVEAMEKIIHLQMVVETAREYYLFEPEPDMPGMENAATLEVADLNGDPYGAEMIGHLKAVYALASLERALAEPGDEPSALFQQAFTRAEASLEDNKNLPDTPVGSSENNLIGLYVKARAAKEIAANNLFSQPHNNVARGENQASLDTSLKTFEQLDPLVAAKPALNPSQVKAQTTIGIEELEEAELFLSQSRDLVMAGAAEEARDRLWQGLIFHPKYIKESLWLQWAENARRSGDRPYTEILAQLDLAEQNELVTQDGKEGVALRLTRNRIVIHGVFRQWQQLNVAGGVLPQEARDLLVISYRELTTLVESVDADTKPRVVSLLTRAAAIIQSDDPQFFDSAERVRVMKLGMNEKIYINMVLEPAAKGDPFKEMEVREYLVDCLFGLASLATVELPKYDTMALAYFHYAMDEVSMLPYEHSAIGNLGTPLLTVLENRTTDDDDRSANEELRRRYMMTRFVRAMYSDEPFGTTQLALDELDDALAVYQEEKAAAEQNESFNAKKLAGLSDSFDANVTMYDSVRVFRALGAVRNNQADDALFDLVQIVLPEAGIDKVDLEAAVVIREAVEKLESPFVGYGFILALESKVDHMGIVPTPLRSHLLESARIAHKRTGKKMEEIAERERYPQLPDLVVEASGRLDDPQFFPRAVRNAATENRAADLYRRAVVRHPTENSLWAQYLEARLLQISLQNENPKLLGELNQELADLLNLEGAVISREVLRYYQGMIFQQQNNLHAAEKSYTKAIDISESPETKIKALSRLATSKSSRAAGNVELPRE